MRAMLDQLMGKDRDVPLDQRVVKRKAFSDPDICKHALAGLCPFGLFANTRSDMGPCEYEVHDDHIDWEAIQGEYDALPEREKERYGYERALLRLLQRLVSDMDRKVQKAQERARLESMPKPLKPEQQAEVDDLRAQAKELTERSEKLAEDGDVDGSLAAVTQAERLRADAEAMVKRYSAPDRALEVCEVCGVFIQLDTRDAEARRRDHVEGKQYQGWLAIREKYKELQAKHGGGGYPPIAPPAAHRETEEGEVRDERGGWAPDGGDRRRRSRSRSRDRSRRYDDRDRRRYDDRDRRRYDDRDRRYDDRYGGSRRGYDRS
ncbi:hypothetical protein ABPG77_004308 [Micractinium sp. CCAP 211/92]